MKENLKELLVLGIMSGTSMDGLDLALCKFSRKNSIWNHTILRASTLPYSPQLRQSLEDAMYLSAENMCALDHQYGKLIGDSVSIFLKSGNFKADWIASHGHTVFHQPSRYFTLQIGNANDIYAATGIPVINDFRSMDIALGGNGAPLVPVGDEYLFNEYDSCLNLGGFSNISFKHNNNRIAFDICPVNMGLNYLAGKSGLEFDCAGKLGRQGIILPEILDKLNTLKYYNLPPPKSLGREWFIENMLPILNNESSVNDLLRTLYEHIAQQISSVLNNGSFKNVLITGGGAKNSFLIELISKKTKSEIVIPSNEVVDFKEALIFAFLGYLRIHSISNVFSSVTGSTSDHCGGSITGIIK